MSERSDRVVVSCVRCPQQFAFWYARRAQSLCRDCRFVLGKSVEREMWEAA